MNRCGIGQLLTVSERTHDGGDERHRFGGIGPDRVEGDAPLASRPAALSGAGRGAGHERRLRRKLVEKGYVDRRVGPLIADRHGERHVAAGDNPLRRRPCFQNEVRLRGGAAQHATPSGRLKRRRYDDDRHRNGSTSGHESW